MSHLGDLYKHNLALLTDLYQLTMAYGYHRAGIAEHEAVFHLVFRKNPFKGGYAVACGHAGYHIERAPHQQSGQQALVDAFGHGGYRGDGKRGRTAEEHADVELPPELTCPGEVKPAALFDLPMHAR